MLEIFKIGDYKFISMNVDTNIFYGLLNCLDSMVYSKKTKLVASDTFMLPSVFYKAIKCFKSLMKQDWIY